MKLEKKLIGPDCQGTHCLPFEIKDLEKRNTELNKLFDENTFNFLDKIIELEQKLADQCVRTGAEIERVIDLEKELSSVQKEKEEIFEYLTPLQLDRWNKRIMEKK